MRYTLDASVLVKLVVEEGFSQNAVNLVSDPNSVLYGPAIIFYEVGSVLYKMVRKRIIEKRYAAHAYENLTKLPIEMAGEDRSVLPDILDLSMKLGLHFYDCMYIYTAKKTNSILVSSDRKLLTAARGECKSASLHDI